MLNRYFALIVWIALFGINPMTFAADNKFASYVFSGYKDSRERLRSGHYTCTRIEVREYPGQPSGRGPCNLEAWFDNDSGSARYECDYREFYGRTTGPRPDQPLKGGKYVRRGNKAILWLLGWEQVHIQAATKEPPSQIWTPDARAMGLNGFGACLMGWDLSRALADLAELNKIADAKTVRAGGNIVKIVWENSSRVSQIEFDIGKGYLPISFEGSPKTIDGKPGPVTEWGTADYVLVNAVWVPKNVMVATGFRGTSSSRFEMSFDWKSVNESIDPGLFLTRNLSIPDGTPILDIEDGKRGVNLGKIGDMTPHPRLALMEPPDPRRWWQSWTIAAAAIALLAALAFGVRTWLRRSRKPETPS